MTSDSPEFCASWKPLQNVDENVGRQGADVQQHADFVSLKYTSQFTSSEAIVIKQKPDMVGHSKSETWLDPSKFSGRVIRRCESAHDASARNDNRSELLGPSQFTGKVIMTRSEPLKVETVSKENESPESEEEDEVSAEGEPPRDGRQLKRKVAILPPPVGYRGFCSVDDIPNRQRRPWERIRGVASTKDTAAPAPARAPARPGVKKIKFMRIPYVEDPLHRSGMSPPARTGSGLNGNQEARTVTVQTTKVVVGSRVAGPLKRVSTFANSAASKRQPNPGVGTGPCGDEGPEVVDDNLKQVIEETKAMRTELEKMKKKVIRRAHIEEITTEVVIDQLHVADNKRYKVGPSRTLFKKPTDPERDRAEEAIRNQPVKKYDRQAALNYMRTKQLELKVNRARELDEKLMAAEAKKQKLQMLQNTQMEIRKQSVKKKQNLNEKKPNWMGPLRECSSPAPPLPVGMHAIHSEHAHAKHVQSKSSALTSQESKVEPQSETTFEETSEDDDKVCKRQVFESRRGGKLDQVLYIEENTLSLEQVDMDARMLVPLDEYNATVREMTDQMKQLGMALKNITEAKETAKTERSHASAQSIQYIPLDMSPVRLPAEHPFVRSPSQSLSSQSHKKASQSELIPSPQSCQAPLERTSSSPKPSDASSPKPSDASSPKPSDASFPKPSNAASPKPSDAASLKENTDNWCEMVKDVQKHGNRSRKSSCSQESWESSDRPRSSTQDDSYSGGPINELTDYESLLHRPTFYEENRRNKMYVDLLAKHSDDERELQWMPALSKHPNPLNFLTVYKSKLAMLRQNEMVQRKAVVNSQKSRSDALKQVPSIEKPADQLLVNDQKLTFRKSQEKQRFSDERICLETASNHINFSDELKHETAWSDLKSHVAPDRLAATEPKKERKRNTASCTHSEETDIESYCSTVDEEGLLNSVPPPPLTMYDLKLNFPSSLNSGGSSYKVSDLSHDSVDIPERKLSNEGGSSVGKPKTDSLSSSSMNTKKSSPSDKPLAVSDSLALHSRNSSTRQRPNEKGDATVSSDNAWRTTTESLSVPDGLLSFSSSSPAQPGSVSADGFHFVEPKRFQSTQRKKMKGPPSQPFHAAGSGQNDEFEIGNVFSPAALHLQFQAELSKLDAFEASLKQLAATEQMRKMAMRSLKAQVKEQKMNKATSVNDLHGHTIDDKLNKSTSVNDVYVHANGPSIVKSRSTPEASSKFSQTAFVKTAADPSAEEDTIKSSNGTCRLQLLPAVDVTETAIAVMRNFAEAPDVAKIDAFALPGNENSIPGIKAKEKSTGKGKGAMDSLTAENTIDKLSGKYSISLDRSSDTLSFGEMQVALAPAADDNGGLLSIVIPPHSGDRSLSPTSSRSRSSLSLQQSASSFSMSVFDQCLKYEELRSGHQQAVYVLRDKELVDRTKAEVAWLEREKKRVRERGREDLAKNLRKKQRGIILKSKQDREELHRLLRKERTATEERRRVLAAQKSKIQGQIASKSSLRKSRSNETALKKVTHARSTSDTSISESFGSAEEAMPFIVESNPMVHEDQKWQVAERELSQSALGRRWSVEDVASSRRRIMSEVSLEFEKKIGGNVPERRVVSDRSTSPFQPSLEPDKFRPASGSDASQSEIRTVEAETDRMSSVPEDLVKSFRSGSDGSHITEELVQYNSGSFETQESSYTVHSRQPAPLLLKSSTSSQMPSSRPDSTKETEERANSVSSTMVPLRVPLSPRLQAGRTRKRCSSGSEDSVILSQNETFSEQSDIESRLSALHEQLRQRKLEAEKLRREQKRAQRERLKTKEQSLLKQIQAYDAYIDQVRKELDQDMDTSVVPIMRPQIKQPRVAEKVTVRRPEKNTSDVAPKVEKKSLASDEESGSFKSISEASSLETTIQSPGRLEEEKQLSSEKDMTPKSDLSKGSGDSVTAGTEKSDSVSEALESSGKAAVTAESETERWIAATQFFKEKLSEGEEVKTSSCSTDGGQSVIDRKEDSIVEDSIVIEEQKTEGSYEGGSSVTEELDKIDSHNDFVNSESANGSVIEQLKSESEIESISSEKENKSIEQEMKVSTSEKEESRSESSVKESSKCTLEKEKLISESSDNGGESSCNENKVPTVQTENSFESNNKICETETSSPDDDIQSKHSQLSDNISESVSVPVIVSITDEPSKVPEEEVLANIDILQAVPKLSGHESPIEEASFDISSTTTTESNSSKLTGSNEGSKSEGSRISIADEMKGFGDKQEDDSYSEISEQISIREIKAADLSEGKSSSSESEFTVQNQKVSSSASSDSEKSIEDNGASDVIRVFLTEKEKVNTKKRAQVSDGDVDKITDDILLKLLDESFTCSSKLLPSNGVPNDEEEEEIDNKALEEEDDDDDFQAETPFLSALKKDNEREKRKSLEGVADSVLGGFVKEATDSVLQIYMKKKDVGQTMAPDVRKRVQEIMSEVPSPTRSSPRFQDYMVTTYGVLSPEYPSSPTEADFVAKEEEETFIVCASPDAAPQKDETQSTSEVVGGETENEAAWPDEEMGLGRTCQEARQLHLKQLQIEQEIKQLELQQVQDHIPSYYYVREIPNKPPPPYTPPGQARSGEAVPSKREDVLNIVATVTDYLYSVHSAGDDITQLPPPERLGASDDSPRSIYKRFLFDLTKQLVLEAVNLPEHENSPPWERTEYKRRCWPAPKTCEIVNRIVAKRVRILFGFEPRAVKENLIIRWSRKKRDKVDELLVRESQEEEQDWTDFTQDEAVIKNKVTLAILDTLVSETGNVLQDAFFRKVNRLKEESKNET